MAHPGNPLEKTYPSSASNPISRTNYPIAGISTTVYGLEELPKNVTEIACLWLLHPRLQVHESMAALANDAISRWNARPEQQQGSQVKGLLAVSFDQRNHGKRKVDDLANEAWRAGNKRHAPDMFSTYQGTASDVSLLITHLPSYLPTSLPIPSSHIVLGVSLGAHAAWHNLLSDKRITTGIIIIGTPDFSRLMSHRASKSKLADWNNTKGAKFLGSPSFPPALVEAVATSDPAGLLLPDGSKAHDLPPFEKPSMEILIPKLSERRVVQIKLQRTLKGKTILNLSGGSDKMVPYASSVPFLSFLKAAVDGETGWWKGSGVYLEDRVFKDAGHEMTPEMAKVAIDFVGDVLAGKMGARGSKSRL